MEFVENLFISEDSTIRQAMEKLDETARRILLIAPHGKLKAVLTDGDIRRYLVRNGNIEDSVKNIATFNPKYVTIENRNTAKSIMKKHAIVAVPLVDERGVVQSIIFADDEEIIKETHLDLPVVINAGGFGTRLYPYTKILPKPLIPIGETPILSLIMENFTRYGAHDFYVIVNHKKNLIKAFYADEPSSNTIHFVDEQTPLGTGGGLSLLKGKIEGTFFFSNCDILINADYSSIYRQHKKDNNIITMVCAVKRVVIPYGVVNMSTNGHIDSFSEKPEFSFLTNTGLYVVEPEVIENLKEGESISFPEIMEQYRNAGRNVGVYPVSEKAWMDMGQLEELENMRKRLESSE